MIISCKGSITILLLLQEKLTILMGNQLILYSLKLFKVFLNTYFNCRKKCREVHGFKRIFFILNNHDGERLNGSKESGDLQNQPTNLIQFNLLSSSKLHRRFRLSCTLRGNSDKTNFKNFPELFGRLVITCYM